MFPSANAGIYTYVGCFEFLRQLSKLSLKINNHHHKQVATAIETTISPNVGKEWMVWTTFPLGLLVELDEGLGL